MKNFSEYFQIKEATENVAAEMSFSDAESKVKEIFAYLHKLMLQTWGHQKPSWDVQLRSKVISDLQNVIDNLKGNKEKISESKRLVKESIILESPEWLKNITSKNKTITVDRMLNAMQNEIIKILHKLRDEILVKQVSNISGEVGKIGTKVSRNVGRNIRQIGKGIQGQIESGIKVHPEITGEMRENARYGLVLLYNAMKHRTDVKLYSAASGTRQLKYDPNNEQEMANILNKINKGKSFRARIGAKDYYFDITNEADTNRILELISSYEV